jgi:hypothetical protein
MLLAAAFLVSRLASSPAPENTRSPIPDATTSSPAPPENTQEEAAPPGADQASVELARLRSAQPVPSGPAGHRIHGDLAQQPDLYAAEFVRRLLTQDYRQPRSDHLAWVQSESAQTSEPLVVGLVPLELRPRLAVYSVSDTTAQPAPVPSRSEWAALGLQNAYTTVRVERVEEPMAWSNAVASGRISDPGITGRQVLATVTLHYTHDGRDATSTSSVAMTLNIQGPPTRSSWGFVTAVTYTTVPMSAS